MSTVTDVTAEVNTLFADNTSGGITAAELRTQQIDLVTKVEADIAAIGGGGSGGSAALVSTRAAAITTAFPIVSSGGPTYIRTVGYADPNDGGGGTYVRVSSTPNYSSLIWFASLDGQKWALVVKNDPLHIEQAGGGVSASGATNSAAIDAIHSIFYNNKSSYPSGYTYAGPNIQFGPGTYNFAGPYFIKGASKITGYGSGFLGGYSTELKFPVNSDGLVIGAAGTNGRLYNPSIYGDYDGRGTVIRDISIRGGWITSATTYRANQSTGQRGFGILTKGVCTLQNVHISQFAEHGIYTKGTAGGGGPSSEPAFGTADNTDPSESYVCIHGYANNFTYTGVEVETCGGDGFRDRGADANAGNYYNCSATENYGWGFNSYAFLGNWFFGCHSATNGIGASWGNDPTTGKIPGAYQAADDSNASVFTGCYSEGGQAGSVFRGFSMILGGLHAAGSPGQSPTGFRIFNGGTGGGYIDPFHTITLGGTVNVGSANVDQEVMNYNGQIFVRNQFGRLVFGSFGVSDTLAFVVGSGYQAGRGADIDQGSVMYSHGVWLGTDGNYADARFRGVRSALPTSGKFAQGDHIDLRDPASGGAWGYVCTTGGDYAGTPPVWKSKGNLA